MPIRRFTTSLLSQGKQYGLMSGRIEFPPPGSGGNMYEAGGYRYHEFTNTGNSTFTASESLKFIGIPSFAPEFFRRARIQNPMKMKQLQQLKNICPTCKETQLPTLLIINPKVEVWVSFTKEGKANAGEVNAEDKVNAGVAAA